MDFVINKLSAFENDYNIISQERYINNRTITNEIKKIYIQEVLSFFEDIEEYEKCIKLKEILDNLN